MYNLLCYLDTTESNIDHPCTQDCSRHFWNDLIYCSTHKIIIGPEGVIDAKDIKGALPFGADYLIWSDTTVYLTNDPIHTPNNPPIQSITLTPDESILILLLHNSITLLDTYSWTPITKNLQNNPQKCTTNEDFFVITFTDKNVHIYDRNAQLLSQIEPLEGLLALKGIAIRPGGFMAIPQLKNSQLVIALILKNGLKHAEIATQDDVLNDIQWNSNGSILALLGTDKVHLFTCSNAVWTASYCVRFEGKSNIVWDLTNPFKLNLVTAALKRSLHLRNEFGVRDGHYAVIDGQNVRLTHLEKQVIPAPSSGFKTRFDAFVEAVVFGEDGSMHVLLHGGRLRSYSLGEVTSEGFEVDFAKWFLSEFQIEEKNICNLTWIESGVFLASNGKRVYCVRESGSSVVELSENVIAITHCKGTNIIQTESGKLYQYNGEITPWTPCNSLPEPCADVRLSPDEQTYYGLSANHRLFANKREIASGITSFVLNKKVLLYIDFHHRLNATRRVERGSKLLYSFDCHVLLGMPRGNFELICPKTLLIHHLKDLLNNLNYEKSIVIFRKHCVDFNLFVDHDPALFRANLVAFVAALKSEDLAHFIMSLREDDVTKKVYFFAYENETVLKDKIKVITEELRPLLMAKGDHKAVICTFVKADRLSDAFEYMMNKGHDVKEVCLKQLMYLLSAKEVFDGSLSTYDLDLSRFVAASSPSFDPKEFLPFLNGLKSLSPLSYRCFVIDRHLKKDVNALRHANSSDFPPQKLEEVMNLVKEKRLYAAAYQIFSQSHEIYSDLCVSYGDYLMSKRYFRDAALVYNGERSLEAWVKAGEWRNALMDGNAAHKVLEVLRVECRFEEMAEVYLEYLKHPEEAIHALILGGVWDKARELIYRFQRMDILEVNFTPMLEEKAKEQLTFIQNGFKTFKAKFDRLQILIAKPISEEPESQDEDDAYSECGSRASSVASKRSSNRTSASTLATRMSKKKAQRKIYCSKEGSVYEDIALIAELHDLITKVYLSKRETRKLLTALVQVNKRPLAYDIQKEFKSLLDCITNSLHQIWIKPDVESSKSYVPPYQLLEDVLRFPPSPVDVIWELHFLSD